MVRPRLFLGSGKQQRLLESLTSGLASVADVEPWTTVFNPGVNTLDRMVELSVGRSSPSGWPTGTRTPPPNGPPTPRVVRNFSGLDGFEPDVSPLLSD